MTTLQSFMEHSMLSAEERTAGQNVTAWFDDPRNPSERARMHMVFAGGDFEMPSSYLQAAEKMAQYIIDMAREQNVDLESFDDLSCVMGYDIVADELSSTELGAYLLGMAMQEKTEAHSVAGMWSTLDNRENFVIHSTNLAYEIGLQVYGDNYLDCAIDTQSLESAVAIVTAARATHQQEAPPQAH